MARYYWPYRVDVEAVIGRLCKGGAGVLHLSVHTFTPVLGGKVRLADVGLLYDPGRRRENLFCSRWKRALRDLDASLNVRRNYPYSGRADGFTAYLRSVYGAEFYLGIELEVNQKFVLGRRKKWHELSNLIASSLASSLGESEATWRYAGKRQ